MVSGWALKYIRRRVTRDTGARGARERGTRTGAARRRFMKEREGGRGQGESREERVWRGLKIARGQAEYAKTVRYALAIRYLYPYK